MLYWWNKKWKKNALEENIKKLEKIYKEFNNFINNLKLINEEINQKKEKIKLQI